MKVTLQKVGECAFQMDDGRGHRVVIDGPPKLGGTDAGPRPMEMFLSSLASCSAVDVVMILRQQKEPFTDIRIDVEGQRVDAVPAVFESIHLHFAVSGPVSAKKVARAVKLSVEKYCSVAKMLLPNIRVQHSSEVIERDD